MADDFDDEWDDRPPTRGTGRGAAPLPPVALETDFDDDDFDDEYDDDYSDDYDDDRIPVAAMSGDGLAAGRGWGSTAVTAATWLVILAAGAQILAIASGAAEAKVAGFDVLHRIGDGFAALGPWQALLLLFGVLVVAAPRLFGSRDNGSARAAGSAFGIAIPSGIVGVAGALLAFRYQLRQIDLAGNGTDLADVLRLGAQLVAAAGTSLVAFGAGLLSLRAASND